MRWLLIGIGIALGIVAVLAGIGYSMPHVHVAQAEAEYEAPPDSVYAMLANIEGWREWHPSVESLRRVEEDADGNTWRLSGPDGSMTVTVTGQQPPRRFTTLADGGMFIGRWTYHVEPRPQGTLVTITEEARIDNLVVRGLTVFRNQTKTIQRVLQALGAALGERIEPRALT